MIRLMQLEISLGKCWWVVKAKIVRLVLLKTRALLDGRVALALIGREVIGANSGGDSASNRVHKLRIG